MRNATSRVPNDIDFTDESTYVDFSTSYKINELQQRGVMFVGPGDEVYEGMIVGEHVRENDIVVNITEAKQLTNFRTTSKDAAEFLPLLGYAQRIESGPFVPIVNEFQPASAGQTRARE